MNPDDHRYTISALELTDSYLLALTVRGTAVALSFLYTGFGATVLGAYWLTAGQWSNNDTFAYAEVAQRVLAGDRLYTEIWQDKPPFAILYYIVPQLLAPGSAGALQLWLGLWVLLQGAVALVCAGRHSTILQRFAVVVFLALWPLSSIQFIWGATENSSNLFVIVVLFLSYRLLKQGTLSLGAIACAGICVTFSFNTRQNTVFYGIIPLAAILLAHVAWHKTAQRLAALAGGIVAGWLVVMAVVFSTSNLHDYFDTVFLYPRRYATAVGDHSGTAAVKVLLKWLLESPLGIMGATFAGLSLAGDWRKTWKLKCLLLGTGIIGFAQCLLPLKDYPHYWANLFPVAALLAYDYTGCESSAPSRQPALLCATLCSLLIAYATFNCTEAKRSSRPARLNEVAAVVNRATARGDTIYVMSSDTAYLYYVTTARPAHRVFCSFQLNPYWSMILPDNIQDVLADYEKRPPTILVAQVSIVTNKDNHSNMVVIANRLMKQYHYDLIDTVNGHWILKLRSPATPVAPGESDA